MAPSQVLKCHFWGAALPRAGCRLQGNKSPFVGWQWGLLQSLPMPKRPNVLQHDPRIFPSSQDSAFENRVGLGASLGPVETGPGWLGFCPSPGWCWCWCWCIPAERTTKEVFCHCLWPGALASVCFENLRQVLDPPGHVRLHFRVPVRTRQPGEASTSLSQLRLSGDSQDQVRFLILQPESEGLME